MKAVAWTLLAGLFGPLTAIAQFRSEVRRVVIHVTVTDKRGNFVNGLPGSSFRVWENGTPQIPQRSIREDIPVTLGILIDDSGSTDPYRPVMAEALVRMAGALKPEDEMFVAHFGLSFAVDLPPRSHPEESGARLEDLAQRYLHPRYQTGTRLFDSVAEAGRFMEREAHNDKHVLLLLTDGRDTTSLMKLKELLVTCRRGESTIYAIGFDAKKGKNTLDQITEASGGRAYYPAGPPELPELTLQIAQEIRSQYTIVYEPDSGALDGSWRAIRVAVVGREGVSVKCRTGYFAPSAGVE